MEDLHQKVRNGEGIELNVCADLDIAEWTKGGESLLHAAADAGNLRALDHLIKKVNSQGIFPLITSHYTASGPKSKAQKGG